jgi:hypothetical protein
MRELLGGPSARWPRSFPISRSCPVGARGCAAGDAAVEVVPIVLSADGGRREIYAVPGLAEPPAASVAARAFEMLPVASLHIGADGRCWPPTGRRRRFWASSPDDTGTCPSLVEGLGRPVRDWVADTVAERIPTRSEMVRAAAAATSVSCRSRSAGSPMRRARRCWRFCTTRPNSRALNSNSCKARKCRPWANLPAAWRMTSTTC